MYPAVDLARIAGDRRPGRAMVGNPPSGVIFSMNTTRPRSICAKCTVSPTSLASVSINGNASGASDDWFHACRAMRTKRMPGT